MSLLREHLENGNPDAAFGMDDGFGAEDEDEWEEEDGLCEDDDDLESDPEDEGDISSSRALNGKSKLNARTFSEMDDEPSNDGEEDGRETIQRLKDDLFADDEDEANEGSSTSSVVHLCNALILYFQALHYRLIKKDKRNYRNRFLISRQRM